ncbi:MAG: hypothetical protein ACTFAL_15555 [Candidatus Electronema sp. V4]|uniref:hypothetical protein n=1 Tax=Candidatus Electronema sp. V4 TaxID=3454756 RepID=UPI0040553D1B
MMINWFERCLLRRIIRHSCPDNYIIGSSGERGKPISCYEVRLKNSEDEYVLYIREISGKGFSGTHWNNQYSESYPASVPFSCMDNVSVEIQIFIGLQRFIYQSVLECVIHDWTYCNRVPSIIDAINQFFYNQKTLALKERTDVLKILVERYIKEPDDAFGEFKLVEILHGQRWIKHQDSAKQLAHARIILDSLYESGELQFVRDNNSQFPTNLYNLYKLTGKALITLETYEREENRHNQTRNLTIALVIVGIIQAIAGLVQAYIAYLKP